MKTTIGAGRGPTARAALAAVLVLTACSGLERAAARDPQRCERDPKCRDKKDRAADCYTQCVDDPACVDRCRQVTGQK